MLQQIIKTILLLWIKDIDSGNSNISEQEQSEILDMLQTINSKQLSKLESADYIGVSRATFDNYVSKGILPKGKKRRGCNLLFWNKSDLDKYKK